MIGEDWLVERLKHHGVDVYAGKTEFPSLRDRLAHVIRSNRYRSVIAGRHERKPETYAEVFERLYGIKLNEVPRGTNVNTKQSTSGSTT